MKIKCKCLECDGTGIKELEKPELIGENWVMQDIIYALNWLLQNADIKNKK